MPSRKKLIARCHEHRWCNKKGCNYCPKLQPIPEDGGFVPKGLLLVKLPSQCQHHTTKSRKRKHDTTLSTFSKKYQYAKMNNFPDAWLLQIVATLKKMGPLEKNGPLEKEWPLRKKVAT
jgi:hypothetical protein